MDDPRNIGPCASDATSRCESTTLYPRGPFLQIHLLESPARSLAHGQQRRLNQPTTPMAILINQFHLQSGERDYPHTSQYWQPVQSCQCEMLFRPHNFSSRLHVKENHK